MPDGSYAPLIFLFLLFCLSAFLYAAETSLTLATFKNFDDRFQKKIEFIKKLTQDSNKLLATISVLYNIVNIIICAVITSYLIQNADYSIRTISLSIIISIVLILIFGKTIPKACATKYPEAIAIFVSKPIRFIIILFSPIVFILNLITNLILNLFGIEIKKPTPAITETKLKEMVSAGHEEGIIEESEKQMIDNVFDFGENSATDVMTHRTEIISLPIDADYNTVLNIFKAEQYSRIPVYRDDIDHIIGILHFKDFIFTDMNEINFDIKKLLRPPFFSYETKSTSKLFAELRSNALTMAIILDEYGGTLGLVTVQDLVEEIVGDIADEYDDQIDEEITQISETTYIVAGGAKIEDFNEIARTQLESEEYDSMAGYVMETLGAIPSIGEEVIANDGKISLFIEEMDKNRISRIKVSIHIDDK